MSNIFKIIKNFEKENTKILNKLDKLVKSKDQNKNIKREDNNK